MLQEMAAEIAQNSIDLTSSAEKQIDPLTLTAIIVQIAIAIWQNCNMDLRKANNPNPLEKMQLKRRVRKYIKKHKVDPAYGSNIFQQLLGVGSGLDDIKFNEISSEISRKIG